MDMLPHSEALHRVKRMQRWMLPLSIDAVFVLQNADLYYFSGTIQSGLLCIPCEGNPLYLVKKSLARAKQECAWDRLIPFPKLDEAPGILAAEGMKAPKVIGLEMDVLPTDYYFKFSKLFPETRFVDASGAIRRIRMIKSTYEIDRIKSAARMLHLAWERLPEWIKPGVTELEVLAQTEHFLRLQGHQGIQRTRGFNYEVGYGAFSAGVDACAPTAFPGSTGFIGLYPAISNTGSEHRLAPGEPLLVDICGGYAGYLADAARTFSIGNLPSDMREAHAWILDLNTEIESMLKPGVDCSRICDYAFERSEGSPYANGFMGVGDNRMRYVGHGVGLELDELPVLASGSGAKLEPGMVLAIEPKIFFPNRGGVGIENMYRITDTGFEKLTPFREDVICC
ncbi:MAG: aminopeptidase P family protein [Acidobacteria bacterium]|nr:aminopeptidase P family protein [Acidobacteriota bacterium]